MTPRDKLIEVLIKVCNCNPQETAYAEAIAQRLIEAFPQLEESEEVTISPINEDGKMFGLDYGGMFLMEFFSKQEALDWAAKHNFRLKEE